MAHIVHWGKYYPPDMGGIESVTASLARGAAAAGHRVTVVCFDKRRVPFEDQDGAVRVLRAPIELFKASQPLGWRYLRALIGEARRADLVHLHAPNMLAALATLALPRRVKLLVHWHSDVVGKGRLHTLLKPVESAMLRRADCIVCTSQPYADASPTLAPYRARIKVAPIGVPDVAASTAPAHVDEGASPLWRFVGTRRVVLAIGRLVPYKGFHVLVDAARHLPEDCVVVIVGTGPLQAELAAQVRASPAAHRILLAGRVETPELDRLMRRAVLFCLPSVERSEAFGVVIAEAMAYGLPVVATNIPGSGVPWVNQHDESGLNVPVGDPAALAQACNALLASPQLRERLAVGARRRFEARFSERAFVDEMAAIYAGELEA